MKSRVHITSRLVASSALDARHTTTRAIKSRNMDSPSSFCAGGGFTSTQWVNGRALLRAHLTLRKYHKILDKILKNRARAGGRRRRAAAPEGRPTPARAG